MRRRRRVPRQTERRGFGGRRRVRGILFRPPCNTRPVQDLTACLPSQKEMVMSVQLLVIYPPPSDPAEFDRAYREEHLPYAGSRLTGATGVTTKHVLGSPVGNATAYAISVVEFP